jgi:crotonobetainyl-CoA:carnitine CoA-transferase CaiB-like acyl-CoA transferase
MKGQRHMLVTDNDGHWYVIPTQDEQQWQEFCQIPSDDERSWDAPKFALAVGGSPSLVKFSDPTIG